MIRFFLFFLCAPLLICSEVRELPDGIYAAALTPMRADLSCDSEELLVHCQDLIRRGCAGVALFGTTGEGPSFSLEERVSVLGTLIEKGLDAEKVILGNGCSGLSDTVALCREGIWHKCAALLICPPCFYKQVSDEGVIAYYREIIQRVADDRLRIILYHIPQFSGVPLNLHIIDVLRSEFPSIVIGIKESEGNLVFSRAILEKFPHFKLFVGNEKQIIQTVHLGGSGSICGIANLYPELICSLFIEGKRGMVPNPESLEFIFKALQGVSFIPAAKAFMKTKRGDTWSFIRPPLVSVRPIPELN